MNIMRLLGVVLGLTFVSIYGYIFLTEHLAALGSVLGFLVGVLFVLFGVTGKDSVQLLFKKLTGRSFSNGTQQNAQVATRCAGCWDKNAMRLRNYRIVFLPLSLVLYEQENLSATPIFNFFIFNSFSRFVLYRCRTDIWLFGGRVTF